MENKEYKYREFFIIKEVPTTYAWLNACSILKQTKDTGKPNTYKRSYV
jgi:hypothetical protein